MTEDRKPQSADKYIVRFPEGMRDRISEAAKANNRSMNAEIIARLADSLEGANSTVSLPASPIAFAEIQRFADAKGWTLEEAASAILFAGMHSEHPLVYVRAAPGMMHKEIVSIMEDISSQVPPDSALVFETLPGRSIFKPGEEPIPPQGGKSIGQPPADEVPAPTRRIQRPPKKKP